MNTQPEMSAPKKDKSHNYFHVEAATTSAGDAGNAYGPASLIAAGADAQQVGILAALTNLASVFLFTKLPSLIGRIGSRKKAILTLSTLDAMGWLPLIAILLFLRPVNPLWLIPLWIINLIPGMLVAAIRDSWLADIVPIRSMGRYFGLRSAITGAAYLTAFYIMGYVLHVFDKQSLSGFALVFFVIFALSCVSIILYSRMHDPTGKVRKESSISPRDFLRGIRRGKTERFIIYVSLFHFTVYLSSPFIAVYLLNDLNFGYMAFAAVVSSDFIAKMLSATFWGRYSDRVGNLKVLGLVSYLIPVVPLLWLFSPPSAVYLVLVQLVSGVAWAGFDLCSANFVYQNAPAQKRVGYVFYHKAMMTLARALGALAGTAIIPFLIPLFGRKLLALFLLSAVLRFAVAAVAFPRLTPAVETGYPPQDDLVKVPIPIREWVTTPNRGLYYRPREWVHFGRPLVPAPVMVQATQDAASPSGKGLYFRPQEWVRFGQPLVLEAMGAAAPGEATGREAIFYHPEEWAEFAGPIAAELPARSEVTPAREAIFYHPGEWASFVASVAPQRVTARRTPDEAAPGRKAIFYRPEEWARFVASIAPQPAAARPLPEEATPNRGAIFYHPEEWPQYTHLLSPKSMKSRAGEKKVAPEKKALFHRPGDWARFGGKVAASASRERSSVRGKAAASGQGLFFRPRDWAQVSAAVSSRPGATRQKQLRLAAVST